MVICCCRQLASPPLLLFVVVVRCSLQASRKDVCVTLSSPHSEQSSLIRAASSRSSIDDRVMHQPLYDMSYVCVMSTAVVPLLCVLFREGRIDSRSMLDRYSAAAGSDSCGKSGRFLSLITLYPGWSLIDQGIPCCVVYPNYNINNIKK